MHKFQEFVSRIIDITSQDPDDRRRRRYLNIVMLTMMILILIEIPVAAIGLGGPKNTESLILTVGGAFLFFCIILIYFVNRSRPGGLAAYLFLFAFTLIVSFGDTPEELVNGRSAMFFIIPIITASLVLKANSIFVITTIVSTISLLLSISIGRIPNASAILGYYLVAILSWLASSGLQGALNDVRAININLDNLVLERTNELAEALTRERVNADRSQAILNSIGDGVIAFNKDNVAILANPALSELVALPLEQLKSIPVSKFINSEEIPLASQATLHNLFSNIGQPEISSGIQWGKKFLSANIAQVHDSNTKEAFGSVVVFRDTTRETELERMKTNFVAIVSHELRTPLGAILAHAEILKESVYGPLNPQQQEVSNRITVNANRLLGMVGDLLDEAQIRAGTLVIRPQMIQTNSLVENILEAMSRLASEKGLMLDAKIGPEMPAEFATDPNRIQQIMVNLVGNAIKFTENGSIRVRIDRLSSEKWKIEVSDTGIGIPANEVPHVFDIFRQANNSEVSTREYGGFGLGLSIVKQLIELMNGEIQVKSQQGVGSTFSVTLPLKFKF